MILGLCLCGGTKQKPGGVQDGDCQHVCFAKVQGCSLSERAWHLGPQDSTMFEVRRL